MATKLDLIKCIGLEDAKFDYALPQPWCDEVKEITGIYPVDHFIWLYDEKAPMFGRPYPLDMTGWVICVMMGIKWT